MRGLCTLGGSTSVLQAVWRTDSGTGDLLPEMWGQTFVRGGAVTMTMERIEEIRRESMGQYGFGIEAMKRLRVCEHCGRMTSGAEQHCKECKRRLPKETMFHFYKRQHRSCMACDTVVSDEAQYCPQCGEKIEQRSAEGGIE